MDLKRRWVLGWSSVCLLFLSVGTSAQVLKRQTLCSLGPQLKEGQITLQGSVGQPSMVGVSNSEYFTLRAGFIQPPATFRRSLFAVDFEVFPNPFQTEIAVVTSFFPGDELRVMSTSGNRIGTLHISTYASQTKMNLGSVANGSYQVYLIRNNRVIQTQKIIKIE